MLLRMYTRWAEQHGYKVEWLEESAGEERRHQVGDHPDQGENAYGWLKTESGVHRLVRISPFDANARRHTSFASVWVYPVIDDKIEIEVAGQVSAHRHLSLLGRGRPARQQDRQRGAHHLHAARPSIVVACQNERSQHQNRAKAMADAEGAALRDRAAKARGRRSTR